MEMCLSMVKTLFQRACSQQREIGEQIKTDLKMQKHHSLSRKNDFYALITKNNTIFVASKNRKNMIKYVIQAKKNPLKKK